MPNIRRNKSTLNNSILTPEEFLSLVWPQPLEPGEMLELRAKDCRSGKVSNWGHRFHPSIFRFLKEADRYRRTCNIYFGVSTRLGINGGKIQDCYRAATSWLDIDNKGRAKAVTRDDAAHFQPTPNIIVESGTGLHLYWLLDHPIYLQDKQSQLARANLGLCEKFGGDTAPHHVAAVLRVPGFLNRNYSPPLMVNAYMVNLNED